MTDTQAEISSDLNNVVFSSPALRKTDENEDGLCCYSYDSCSDSDSDFVKKCRGAVFDKDTLVFRSFGYTPEYVTNDVEKIKNYMDTNMSSFRVFDSHEGTIIRLFYYNKWYVSTHRKLNAFKSKWSSTKSFGEEFECAIQQYVESPSIDSLTSYIETKYGCENGTGYIFLLRNNHENRIVCNPPDKPSVYYVGTFYENGSKFKILDDFLIPTPREHKNLTTLDEILDYVNSVDYVEKQGVIVFGENTQIKIYNAEYYDWYNVRGNESSLKFRYLQIRTNPILVTKLKILYPSYSKLFDEVEHHVGEITKYIHDAYISRFISKKYTVVDQDSFRVIKECHFWHMSDRKHNIVTVGKVMDVVNSLPHSTLNRMLKNKN